MSIFPGCQRREKKEEKKKGKSNFILTYHLVELSLLNFLTVSNLGSKKLVSQSPCRQIIESVIYYAIYSNINSKQIFRIHNLQIRQLKYHNFGPSTTRSSVSPQHQAITHWHFLWHITLIYLLVGKMLLFNSSGLVVRANKNWTVCTGSHELFLLCTCRSNFKEICNSVYANAITTKSRFILLLMRFLEAGQ